MEKKLKLNVNFVTRTQKLLTLIHQNKWKIFNVYIITFDIINIFPVHFLHKSCLRKKKTFSLIFRFNHLFNYFYLAGKRSIQILNKTFERKEQPSKEQVEQPINVSA